MDVCYVYEYYLNAWYLRKQQPIVCVWLIYGDIDTVTADGKILKEDYLYNFYGSPIEVFWFSIWFSFSNAGNLNELTELDIWLY